VISSAGSITEGRKPGPIYPDAGQPAGRIPEGPAPRLHLIGKAASLVKTHDKLKPADDAAEKRVQRRKPDYSDLSASMDASRIVCS
jgi:hypothetical protein